MTYPTRGLENWDDELQVYIDAGDAAAAAAGAASAATAEANANTYTDAAVAGIAAPDWTDVTGKPATFTPAAHTHPQSDITNLTTDLANKANDGDVVKLIGAQTVTGVKTFTSPPVVPDSSFTIAAITDLQTELDAKDTEATTTDVGIVRLATTTEAVTGTAASLAATPAGLAARDAQYQVGMSLWNSGTDTWEARPTWARRNIYYSTDDASATAPTDAELGDEWHRHPSAS